MIQPTATSPPAAAKGAASSPDAPGRAIAPREQPLRCLTIDVEEYFHIEAAYHVVGPAHWKDWPTRIQASMDLLLAMFDRLDRKATFFVLGDVARRQPALARQIADAGHEVASHGTNHDRLHRLGPDAFRDDLLASKKLLEDQTGRRIIGYRAPTFSIVPQTAWAIDILLDAGFEYDASIFPVRHPYYGVPSAPDQPFMVQSKMGAPALLEIPPLTWSFGSRKLPVAGGGYFRLLPLWFMKRGLRQAAAQHRPAVLYFHPWEFDPDQPRMPLSATGRLRTYTGLKTAAAKLESIVSQPGRWQTIAEALPELRERAANGPTFNLADD